MGEINSIWTTSETIPIETESSRQKGLVGNLAVEQWTAGGGGGAAVWVMSRALGSRWGRRAADWRGSESRGLALKTWPRASKAHRDQIHFPSPRPPDTSHPTLMTHTPLKTPDNHHLPEPQAQTWGSQGQGHVPAPQFSSVQWLSCVRLCNPTDWGTPGFPVPHQLLELAQIHVHWVQQCQPAISALSQIQEDISIQSWESTGQGFHQNSRKNKSW